MVTVGFEEQPKPYSSRKSDFAFHGRGVRMMIDMAAIPEWSYVDWDTVRTMLSRPNFSHLKRFLLSITVTGVSAAVYPPNYRMMMLNWLASRLRACHARGIFKLDVIVKYDYQRFVINPLVLSFTQQHPNKHVTLA
jgi:hypothetical protein